jgi:HSP20 family protein
MDKSLTRWDPTREMVSLREAMDRLFSESFIRPWFGPGRSLAGESVALDMYETDDEIVVEAGLPGFKPNEVDVQVTGNVLTIKGEHKEEKREETASYIYQERRHGSSHRSVTLPSEVNVDKAKAQFEDGVLKLSIPKLEKARPKTIAITSK